MSTNTYRTNDRNTFVCKEAAEPLLDEDDTNETQPNVRAPAVLLGLLVGIIVQLATVGINVLVLATFGTDMLQRNRMLAAGLPIIYNIVTLLFVYTLLAIVRNLLKSANQQGRQSNDQKRLQEDDRISKSILAQFEGNFVLGALMGACMHWLVADLLLGMSSRAFSALLPLNIILFLYMLLGFVADCSNETPLEEDEETYTIRSTGGSSYRNGPFDV